MTAKQKLLAFIYPFLIRFSGKAIILKNTSFIKPFKSFYDIPVVLNNNDVLQLNTLKGKKILIVNTASDCGYTAQYKELQQLYDQFKNQLIIIAFPSNDFKEQEKENDAAILQFCQVNYNIRFHLAKKSQVVKGKGQHELFQWMTDKNLNGWNDQQPKWNFCKYLVNEEGTLTHYFDTAITPVGREIKGAISKGLF